MRFLNRRMLALFAVLAFVLVGSVALACTSCSPGACDQLDSGYTPAVGTGEIVSCPKSCHENPCAAECSGECANAIFDQIHGTVPRRGISW